MLVPQDGTSSNCWFFHCHSLVLRMGCSHPNHPFELKVGVDMMQETGVAKVLGNQERDYENPLVCFP